MIKGDVSPDVSLADLLLLLKKRVEFDLHVSAPATVVAYEPVTRMAQVTLGYIGVTAIADVEAPLPPTILLNVPVAQPQSTTGWSTIPITPGTTGNVVFSDRGLQKWISSATIATPAVDPVTDRAHSPSDGVFYPGLIPTPAAATTPHDNTAAVVEGPLVKLGAASTDFVIKGTTYAVAEATFLAGFSAWFTALAANMVAFPAMGAAFSAAQIPVNAAFAPILAAWLVAQNPALTLSTKTMTQ